jgi:hypothetical protein
MNGRWDSETKGSWTAISRAPNLKAVILLGKGDGWNGGGLFLNAGEYWVNGYDGHTEVRTSKALRRRADYKPPAYYGGECPTVYFNRLQRDGWEMKRDCCQGAVLFEKHLPKSWVLRRLAFTEIDHPPGRGVYWDAHELKQESTGTLLSFPEWEWAEFDRGRLVWAAEGQLRTARLGTGKLTGERLLRDFNDMKFKAITAPY